MSIVLGLVLILCMVLIGRTVTLKPTSAKATKIQLDTSDRSVEYGKRLAEMIKKETISAKDQVDREKYYQFHEVLEMLFPNIHQYCEKIVFDGSLLFKWSGKGNHDPILFMSHHDVVEANGVWQHEPFSGDIDERGRVWGRGTVDTKASLFCMLQAVEELIKDGYEPECDVYIASSCTEEWGGDGAPKTVAYLKEKGIHLAYVMDEGGMIIEEPIAGVKGTYGMVGVLEKGSGNVKFVAKSNGGHASAPKKNTPLVRLGKFMSDVEKNYPFKSILNPTVREMFQRLTPNMDFGMKFVFSNLWLFKGILIKVLPSISQAAGAMLHTTIAFTTAKGSDGLNVLPQEAYVTGNMRFIPHQDAIESIEVIQKVAKKYNIEAIPMGYTSSCPVVDYHSDAFHKVEEVAQDVYPGIGIVPYVMTGGTDAKFYRDLTPNCLRFAPLYIDNQQYGSIHGLDENIYQGALPMGVDFYKGMIKKS